MSTSTISMTSSVCVPILSFIPLAHVADAPRGWEELATSWSLDPLLMVSLLASAWVYRRGARRLRNEVSDGRGIRRWERACFWMGWWTLALSLVSPLHGWGQALFSAHMTQHELLMLVAAPLLVLGRPVVAFLFAIPRQDARQVARLVRRPGLQRAWRVVSHPIVAWLIHAVMLWSWHAPALYQATLTNDFLHHLQHVCFFGSAVLFWWSILHAAPGAAGVGAGVLYLFTTMVHSGLLGALITFSDALVYPVYQYTVGAWGMSALEDQQLGGLIMWVPAGFVYIVAALAMIGSWLSRAERTRSHGRRFDAGQAGSQNSAPGTNWPRRSRSAIDHARAS